jgi:hypothetical protein
VWPAADVDDDRRQRLVHRNTPVGEPLDTAFLAQRLRKRLSEADRHVLNGVVIVDIQVAVTPNRQVEQTVCGKRPEHVIEKADTGVDGRLAVAVERECHLDLGLGGLAADGGCSVGHAVALPASHMTVAAVRAGRPTGGNGLQGDSRREGMEIDGDHVMIVAGIVLSLVAAVELIPRWWRATGDRG